MSSKTGNNTPPKPISEMTRLEKVYWKHRGAMKHIQDNFARQEVCAMAKEAGWRGTANRSTGLPPKEYWPADFPATPQDIRIHGARDAPPVASASTTPTKDPAKDKEDTTKAPVIVIPCETCNSHTHKASDCFMTNVKAREAFLKRNPNKRAEMEDRVAKYEDWVRRYNAWVEGEARRAAAKQSHEEYLERQARREKREERRQEKECSHQEWLVREERRKRQREAVCAECREKGHFASKCPYIAHN